MSVLSDTWRGLVQRRLWPLALLLLAALAAVPFALAEAPEPVAAPSAQVAGDTTDLAAQPVVTLAPAESREDRRRVFGSRKDPFEPAPAPKKQAKRSASRTSASGATTAAATPEAPSPASSPSGTPGGSGLPSPPPLPSPSPVTPVSPAAPREEKPRREVYSLTVRWGASTDESRPATNVKRLKALPSNEDPAIIYLGVLEDRKTAVFMVDALVEPVGDGSCRPSPLDCQTLHLRAGETQYFDVLDEAGNVQTQYQLDLVEIHRATATTRAGVARTEARGGRTLLRARLAQAAGYDYDADRGVLDRLGAKAVKAKLARIAQDVGF